jgi:hypothetical protein
LLIVAEDDLSTRMKTLAKSGHARADDLNACADKLEAVAGSGSPMALLGTWARARRLWSECTGEPLL